MSIMTDQPTFDDLYNAERAAYEAWVDAALSLAHLVEAHDTDHPAYAERKAASAAAHAAWKEASEAFFVDRTIEASIATVNAELEKDGA